MFNRFKYWRANRKADRAIEKLQLINWLTYFDELDNMIDYIAERIDESCNLKNK